MCRFSRQESEVTVVLLRLLPVCQALRFSACAPSRYDGRVFKFAAFRGRNQRKPSCCSGFCRFARRCGSLHARRRGTTVAFLNLPLFAAGIRGNRRAAPAFAGLPGAAVLCMRAVAVRRSRF